MSNEEFLNSITPLERGIYDFYRMGMGVLEFGANDKILEIGSGWGIFARIILMLNPEVHLTTIDCQKVLKDFDKNTQGFEDRITRIVGRSKDVLKKFSDSSFDTVFVDGDHGYTAYHDLMEALRICKKRGRIIVDDVMHSNNWKGDYRVAKAVRDFCMENKFAVTFYPVAHGIAIIKT